MHLLDFLLEGAERIDGALLLLPLGVETTLLFAQLGQLLIQPLQPITAGGIRLPGQGELFHLQLQDAPIELINLLWLGGDLHLQSRGRFIHEIDGLIGKEAIGDIAARQHGGSNQGVIGNAHAMVHLITLLETPKDGDCVFHGGLINKHLLETTFQGWILFDVLAMFIQGGGTDAAQFTAGEHRLEQVAGIHGATTGTGSHDSMNFVDKKHNLPLRGGYLLEHRLEPFFKLTAVFGAGNQSTHIQGDQLTILEGLGHVTIDNPLGQTFHDRRFTNPRFTN